MNEQTLTLAAICQTAYLVQQISRKGQTDEEAIKVMLQSILNTSPENTLDVYGGELANLKIGLETLLAHLGNQSSAKDPELTRYVVSLISLERRLKPKIMNQLANSIEQSKRQLLHYDIQSETMLASLAGIYSENISPLSSPIQVAGNPEFLKNTLNQHKIRALLLAGIRATVLWRQVGGKRRTILFSRAKLVACAEQLHRQI